MRTIFCFLLSCFSVALWAQDIKKVKLKVYNAYCIPEAASPSLVTVSLYLLPKDSLVFWTFQNETTGETTDEALLLPGRYKAVYYNTVMQKLEKEIIVGRRDTAIGFCIDSLMSYPLNTLALFKDKDSLMISHSFEGCFAFGSTKLVISCDKNIFTASSFVLEENTEQPANSESPDEVKAERYKQVKTVQMNAAQINAFRRFENEFIVVNHVNGGTTSVCYSIKSRYLNITKCDEAAYWGGYRDLHEALFGKDRE